MPANEPDIIAWNDWIVSDFLVSTGVRVGKTVNGSPLYFAERHVVNQTLLDQALKGSVSSTPNQSTSVGSKQKATDAKADKTSESMSGGKTRSEWTTILLEGDSETRKKAIAALIDIGDHPKETLDALEAALQGMDSDVARLAATALGKSGDAGIDRLISGLSYPEDGVRAACMTALVSERNPNTVPALVKLLDHSEKATAVAASTVLMSMGEKAVPELIKGLSGRGVQARGWAAIVLGKIGPSAKSAIPRLKTMLDDPYPPNRAIAADALSKIDR